MPVYREQGVVIRTQKLGEADRIVTILTHSRGLLRAVAKGVRRTNSKFGSRLEPFMVADMQLYEGRTLDTITQAVTLGSYGAGISSDYDKYRAASVMVEAAERISEGGPSPEQFRLIVGGLRTLAAGTVTTTLVRDGYLLRALAAAGWAPGFSECVKCGLPGPHHTIVVQMGGVVCETCRIPGSPIVEDATLALLSALLSGDWEAASVSSERAQGQASGVIAAYTQWHLERSIKSFTSR